MPGLCRLVIKDECNVKFEDLDASTRRRCESKLKYLLPYAYHVPAFRLGRWDGKIGFFTTAGATYLNLLDRVLPILDEEGWTIEIDDRRPVHDFEFAEVTADTFADTVWPKNHPAEGQPILLRDYQIECINRFLSNQQGVQEIATGAGKTLITAGLSRCCEPYGRTLIIVPNKDLVKQTQADYVNLGLDVGVFFGDEKDLGHTHTIATWQSINSLIKRYKDGLSDVGPDALTNDLVCIMIDECFSGDSQVLTPDGYVAIKDIKPGDKVINYSEKTKEFKIDTVIKQHRNLINSRSEKMYELDFDNGSKIQVTGNHKFLTTVGWVRADELTEHHEIVNTNINTDSQRRCIYEKDPQSNNGNT